jgi:hypothetical protein
VLVKKEEKKMKMSVFFLERLRKRIGGHRGHIIQYHEKESGIWEKR